MRRLAVLVALVMIAACTPPGLPEPLPPIASSSGSQGPDRPQDTLVIGTDTMPSGFNPHAVADFSVTARTVTELVLPSASRIDRSGTVRIDPDLIRSAVVTSLEPFTVTYRVRTDASWSDGTPVTAEDFAYLAEQMVTQPATVAPAGYRMIDQVVSRDAGKTVVVEFSRPVADWTELFSPLLPSHLMRDSPGGWAEALTAGIPVSGGQYKMTGFDPVTGLVELVRNDKYWGEQPGPARVELRVGEEGTLRAALDRGDLDALVRGRVPRGEADPSGRSLRVPVAATTVLMLAMSTEPTDAVTVRRALGRAVDSVALATAAGTVGTPVTSLMPTTPVLDPAVALPIELTPDPDLAAGLLTRAGFVPTAGVYRKRDDQVLRLVLGLPADRPDLDRIAVALREQLTPVGVELSVVRDSPAGVLSRLAAGTITMALLDRPIPVSKALSAASEFGCGEPVAVDPADGFTQEQGLAPGNPMGFCSTVVDAALDRWVEGDPGGYPIGERLLRELPVLPVQGIVWQIDVSPALADVTGVAQAPLGWSWTGPLAGLASWTSVP